ncbi:MAG: hypothetical protein HOC71_04915 [Candidatus Latescibacteria bacterium]|jgi:type 1 glutamine amidotransferase|nr:hypothetical protein [Candidatus Latescibacterota bacterium]
MGLFNKTRKRRLFRKGLPAVAAATVAAHDVKAAIFPKTSGEIKVVAIFGTTENHNGIGHEQYIRRIFESKQNWRLIFVRANKMFNPELISDADLLMVCRDDKNDPIDFTRENALLSETIDKGTRLWTDDNVKAIISNVRSRGMGLLTLHNTILCGNSRFMDFIDVRGIEAHAFQPIWHTRINKAHPIMEGVGKFSIMHDEQLAVIIKSKTTATLFESTSVHEKRQAISGWALKRGEGRIAGLLPGSTVHAYETPEYQNIVWRAAHWALKHEIPTYPKAKNRYY